MDTKESLLRLGFELRTAGQKLANQITVPYNSLVASLILSSKLAMDISTHFKFFRFLLVLRKSGERRHVAVAAQDPGQL